VDINQIENRYMGKNPFRSVFNRFKSVYGFTLIELMIVMVITVFLIGGGIAAYTNFNERQTVKSAGTQLYNDLRFAQSKASSQEKPAGCGQGAFEGYVLDFTGTSYVIDALCGGSLVDAGISRTLPLGVVKQSGDDSTSFFSLGRGSTANTICLSGFGRFYTVAVSASGEIEDTGFASSC